MGKIGIGLLISLLMTIRGHSCRSRTDIAEEGSGEVLCRALKDTSEDL
jgi:hypothetical protein